MIPELRNIEFDDGGIFRGPPEDFTPRSESFSFTARLTIGTVGSDWSQDFKLAVWSTRAIEESGIPRIGLFSLVLPFYDYSQFRATVEGMIRCCSADTDTEFLRGLNELFLSEFAVNDYCGGPLAELPGWM